ncbi:9306_t:CDS:1, partial [Funneliformis caledonium]
RDAIRIIMSWLLTGLRVLLNTRRPPSCCGFGGLLILELFDPKPPSLIGVELFEVMFEDI